MPSFAAASASRRFTVDATSPRLACDLSRVSGAQSIEIWLPCCDRGTLSSDADFLWLQLDELRHELPSSLPAGVAVTIASSLAAANASSKTHQLAQRSAVGPSQLRGRALTCHRDARSRARNCMPSCGPNRSAESRRASEPPASRSRRSVPARASRCRNAGTGRSVSSGSTSSPIRFLCAHTGQFAQGLRWLAEARPFVPHGRRPAARAGRAGSLPDDIGEKLQAAVRLRVGRPRAPRLERRAARRSSIGCSRKSGSGRATPRPRRTCAASLGLASPLDRRRLRIVNGIFLAVSRVDARPGLQDFGDCASGSP